VEELKNNKEKNMKQKAPEKKKKIYVQTNDGRPQQSKPIEIINVETEVVNVEEQSSKTPQNILVRNNNNVNESGSKAQEPAPILQANSFHILSPVSLQELLRVQDKQLENELNDGTDDSWSTDSQGSFVDTTQVVADVVAGEHNNEIVSVTQGNSPPCHAGIRHDTYVPMDGETSKHNEAVQIPNKVARDMAFLKKSWANMTEADEAFQNIEATSHNADTTDQGFQIHMSKQQKKSQKKLKQSSRDSYATRSKVPPKPFR
jgi:hypothetical protein